MKTRQFIWIGLGLWIISLVIIGTKTECASPGKPWKQTSSQWTVTPDTGFSVPGSTPNVGWVDNQVWLIVGTREGQRLYRSMDGTNKTQAESIKGLSTSLTGTDFVPTETVPREAADGTNELYVLGLGRPETSSAVLFRLRDNGQGQFARSPEAAVYRGSEADKDFIGVPDVYPALDGTLRLMYVARGSSVNSNTAVSTDGGASFQFEFNNPFQDYGLPLSAQTNNVDPAVVKLASGSYLAVTMRATKLYLFTSSNGREFTPVDMPALEGSLFGSPSLGFFDPTLVQLPDGRVLMFATLGDFRSPGNEKVVRFVLTQNQPEPMPPIVKVTGPNGGETIPDGSSLAVSWSTTAETPVASQSIALSTDGGTTFALSLATGLAAPLTEFQVALPVGLSTTRARVQVTALDTAGNSGSDQSDGDFSIVTTETDTQPPQVQVLSPNGGEKVKVGQSVQIQWQAADETALASHEIRLSTDGGASFPTVVASGLPADARGLVFVIPASQSKTKTARILVVSVDMAGNRGQDASDGNFRIAKKRG